MPPLYTDFQFCLLFAAHDHAVTHFEQWVLAQHSAICTNAKCQPLGRYIIPAATLTCIIISTCILTACGQVDMFVTVTTCCVLSVTTHYQLYILTSANRFRVTDTTLQHTEGTSWYQYITTTSNIAPVIMGRRLSCRYQPTLCYNQLSKSRLWSNFIQLTYRIRTMGWAH